MDRGALELELKFTGAPQEVSALPRSRFLRSLSPSQGRWERLTSVYFDTPGNTLAEAGLSLRIRNGPKGHHQTIKRTTGAGSVVREEFETSIEDGKRFFATTGIQEIDDIVSAALPLLAPIITITVDRWVQEVHFGATRIEIAIDLGRAETAKSGGAAPVAEMEIEFVCGNVADFFDFARLVADNTSLRFSIQSKLDQGRGLVSGRPYRLGKQIKPRVDAETLTAEALQSMLAAIAVRIAGIQASILDIRAPEGIHQMRVALRRFRAIERTFRKAIKGRALYALTRRARSFAKALGPARDFDVFVGETMQDVFSRSISDLRGARALETRAGTFRAEVWADAYAVIVSRDFVHFTIDMMEAAILAPWKNDLTRSGEGNLRDYAPRALEKARDKVLATNAAMDRSRIAARHPLRIKIKKLRYAAQMLAPLYDPDRRQPFMGSLSTLQKALGKVNDAVVAGKLAEQTRLGIGGDGLISEGVRAAGFVSGYKAAEAEAALAEIDLAWRAFEETVPFWHDE